MPLIQLNVRSNWREEAPISETAGFACGQLVRSVCVLVVWPLHESLLGPAARLAPLLLVLLVVPPLVAFLPRLTGSLSFARTVSLAVTLTVLICLRYIVVGSAQLGVPLLTGERAALALVLTALCAGLLASLVAAVLSCFPSSRGERRPDDGADARFLVDQAMDVLLLQSAGGAIRSASAAARAVLGAEPAALIGTRLIDWTHPEDRAQVESVLTRASYFGASATAEIRMRHTDGHDVWIDLRCRPVVPSADGSLVAQDPRSASGAAFETIAVLREAGERRRYHQALVAAREEALSASHAKSRFLANMSHELRTPLNAVIGFSEVMTTQMFGPLGGKYLEYAQYIHRSGLHLLELINDVLDMSKIEAGKWELRIERFGAAGLADEALEIVALAAEHKKVAVHADVEPEALEIAADRRALKQILLNLLSNAIKFTPAGGEVKVVFRQTTEETKLIVSDTGIGIPPDALERLCAPFEQAGGEFVSREKGTGLGLALVKALTELHGGMVAIRSAPDEGTEVTVALPRAGLSAAEALAAHPACLERGVA